MRYKVPLLVFAALLVGLVVGVGNGLRSPTALAGQADPAIVVTLKGEGLPVAAPAGIPGLCFETTLFNTHTGAEIGTGIDCLDILADDGAGSFSINRTTIFSFPQGQLVANGLTTVVPVFGGSSPGSTHIVGDVDDSTLNIVSGTHAFAGSSGNVRLSGAVNLANFPNTIGFNCIFIIDLD